MKSLYIKLGVCTLIALSLITCKKENELAFSPNVKNDTIVVGQSVQLAINSYGVKSSTPYSVSGVSWSVLDPFVAVINNDGVLTGKKVGETKACAKFDDGKVCYVDVVVKTKNHQYTEPARENDQELVRIYEASVRDSLRGGDDYLVYKNNSDEEASYVIYLFGPDKLESVVCFYPNKIEGIRTGFLSDRYQMVNKYKFVTRGGLPILVDEEEYGPTVYYNINSDLQEIFNNYKADIPADLEKAINPQTYNPDSLRLALKFDLTLSAAQASEASTIKSTGESMLSKANTFPTCETAADYVITGIKNLYLSNAKEWSKYNWCYSPHIQGKYTGGLRGGLDQTKYCALAWAKVSDVNDAYLDALKDADSFQQVDALTITYGNSFYDIATIANQNTEIKKAKATYDKVAEKQSTSKAKYSNHCFAEISRMYTIAVDSLQNKIIKPATLKSFSNELTKTDIATDGYYSVVADLNSVADYVENLNGVFSLYRDKKSEYTASNFLKIEDKYNQTLKYMNTIAIFNLELASSLKSASDYFKSVEKKEK